MSLRLDLLRHGHTEHSGFRGRLDDPLTERGWQQMLCTLADEDSWTRVISSPLQRCQKFAQFYSQQRRIPIQLEPRLQELDFGAWEGQTAAQLMQDSAPQLSQFWTDPYSTTPPDGESLTHFSQRVHAALMALERRYAGEHLLVITHGGVMKLLIAEARGWPKSHLLRVEVPHAHLNRLHYENALLSECAR